MTLSEWFVPTVVSLATLVFYYMVGVAPALAFLAIYLGLVSNEVFGYE